MNKVLTVHKGRNVEVYLEKAVIKIKSEQDLIQDVKETLYKLQRVNMKLDPSGCAFGMEEGKFLGYMATTEGIKSDLEKVRAILRGTTPEGPETRITKEPPTKRETSRGTDPNTKGLEAIHWKRAQQGRLRREYLNAIRLNFHASKDDMDYEALLAGLVASAGRADEGGNPFDKKSTEEREGFFVTVTPLEEEKTPVNPRSDGLNSEWSNYQAQLGQWPNNGWGEMISNLVQNLIVNSSNKRKCARQLHSISIWKAFRGNTRDLGSFGEEKTKLGLIYVLRGWTTPQDQRGSDTIPSHADFVKSSRRGAVCQLARPAKVPRIFSL
ncbi:hypothetical protein Tco_0748225 [Tanacetum coccineum]|uniref:Reverse transcriptase n=1 Tax=Tanacetum coccineum TaxID=301880 RepID=A0ABQ4YV07_9ASTR